MADVRIHSVESQITLSDEKALLTPDAIDKIARLVAQKLRADAQSQRERDRDRQLTEGAGR